MQPFRPLPVRPQPFPHVVVDDYLEPALYRDLLEAFPSCPPGSGPTGFTLFWGDADYNRLLATSPPWQSLFERVQSQEFVDYCLAQFWAEFRAHAIVDLERARYVRYCETREDKERRYLSHVDHAPDELWVRLDILQGRPGYHRGAHLDHRRRAATMLIYFCDADEIGMIGGELVLEPSASGGEPVSIAPRHNRMVMFPCHNESLHSVSPIQRQAGPRNFLQITVSSSVDLWEPLPAHQGGSKPSGVPGRTWDIARSVARRLMARE